MLRYLIPCLLAISFTSNAIAEQSHSIPILISASRTFYIEARIGELNSSKFMLDTGSGYTTINNESFQSLQKDHKIRFVKKIMGVLADGSQRTVDIWEVESLTLNGVCTLKNIQVALMPGTSRQILGLTTLTKAAPFTVSLDPPKLTVSNCI